MVTVLLESNPTSFYTYLITLLINSKPYTSLFSSTFHCEQPCGMYELEKQAQQFSQVNLADAIKIFDPYKVENIDIFMKYFLYEAHNHAVHSEKGCPAGCPFHSGLYMMGSILYKCENSHHCTEEITSEMYSFTIDAYHYFTLCPEIIKKVKEPCESLVCCYAERLISNYSSNPLTKCLSCGSNVYRSISLDYPPQSLFFIVDYQRPANMIEKLRVLAGFPSNFSSAELFETSNACNYTIVGFLLKNKKNYASVIYSEKSRNWVYLAEGQQSIKSKYETISQLLIDEYQVLAVIYHQGQNQHDGLKELMWITLENRIVKRVSKSDKGEANIANPTFNKYWTCRCKKINYNLNMCSCGEEFGFDYFGWTCACSRKNMEKLCTCGREISICVLCKEKFSISKQNEIKSCEHCKNWVCGVCGENEKFPIMTCKRCSNPCSLIFADFKFLQMP